MVKSIIQFFCFIAQPLCFVNYDVVTFFGVSSVFCMVAIKHNGLMMCNTVPEVVNLSKICME